jgi:hypothetical protein
MKYLPINRTVQLLLFAVICVVSGCSTFQPISSKPPVSSLVLAAPVTEKLALSTHILPAGEYKATYEDSGGYYYQAPSKVISKDFMAYLEDGGIYIPRGSTKPTRFYILANYGQKVLYHLPNSEGIELKP